ncbi:unnamed protein product [Scytosiphon promiscuus]
MVERGREAVRLACGSVRVRVAKGGSRGCSDHMLRFLVWYAARLVPRQTWKRRGERDHFLAFLFHEMNFARIFCGSRSEVSWSFERGRQWGFDQREMAGNQALLFLGTARNAICRRPKPEVECRVHLTPTRDP